MGWRGGARWTLGIGLAVLGMTDTAVTGANPAATQAIQEHPLHLVTEEAPPLTIVGEDGGLSGASVDIVRAMAARANVPITLDVYPWARAIHSAETTAGTCVFSTWVTEARLPRFRWVRSLGMDGMALFALETSPIAATTRPEDLQGLSIVTTRGWAILEELQRLDLDDQIRTLDRDPQNLTVLASGRADLWAGARSSAPFIARQHGLTLRTILSIKDVDLGLACHRSTPEAVIRRLQAVLDRLWADGTVQTIRSRYYGTPLSVLTHPRP